MTPSSDDWRQGRACTDEPPTTFFPNRGDTAAIARAREVCNACPVKADCYDYGLRNERWGMWGGASQRHLKAERRRQGIVLPVMSRVSAVDGYDNGTAPASVIASELGVTVRAVYRSRARKAS